MPPAISIASWTTPSLPAAEPDRPTGGSGGGPIDAPKLKSDDRSMPRRSVMKWKRPTKMMADKKRQKDEAELKKARKDFYLNLFEPGHVTTFAKDKSGNYPKSTVQRKASSRSRSNLPPTRSGLTR